ncbi:MAG TPA: YigZ family protein [Bacteroidia bacterium]|nr:YigZ family protein [Bacteroidia bacterium]
MLFSDSYFTINKPAQGSYRDKGSKFLSHAYPVQNENEIKEKLQELKKEHPSARHHCYAWRLGVDGAAYRANDDGEPSGTAGKPILNQLQSSQLTNVLIVVVRYFGGTLLGVAGLIQAYKLAAADAIINSDIAEKFVLFEYALHFEAEDTGPVMKLLNEEEAKIIGTGYDKENTITFMIKKSRSEVFEEKVKALYKTKLKYLKTH